MRPAKLEERKIRGKDIATGETRARMAELFPKKEKKRQTA